MKKLFFSIIFSIVMLFSCITANAAMQDDSNWHWLISNESFGMFIDTSTIRFSNSNKKIDKHLISGWILYVYDSSHAKKYLSDEHTRYGKIYYQINTQSKKIRNLQQIFYDDTEQYVSDVKNPTVWENVVPGTNGNIAYSALSEYAEKYEDKVIEQTMNK